MMPDQKLYFHCKLEGERSAASQPDDAQDGPAPGAADLRVGRPFEIDVPIDLPSPTTSADLKQAIPLGPGLDPIHLDRYLPKAVLDQQVVPSDDPAARPAVELAVEGPTQSYRRWLLADDPARNRLVSFIATWRYMAVDQSAQRDVLFEQFQNEWTREPKIIASRAAGGPSAELPARAGAEAVLAGTDGKVRVLEFLPDFARDDKTGKPLSRSDEPNNPAAHVEIRYQGQQQHRWIFARFPDYKSGDGPDLPVRVTLDSPVGKPGSTPDFAIVTIADLRSGRPPSRPTQAAPLHELWIRLAGATQSRSITVDESVPIEGSPYAFRITRFIPTGRLIEEYRQDDAQGKVAALRLRTRDAAGAEVQVWLEINQPRVISTPRGLMTVAFGPRQVSSAKGHR